MTIWPLKPGTSTTPKAAETKSKQGPVKRPAVDEGRAIGLGATGSGAEAEGTSAEDTLGMAGGEGEGRNKGVPETCDMKKRKEQKKTMLGDECDSSLLAHEKMNTSLPQSAQHIK